MQRETVNPWTWSHALGYDQGLVVSGVARTLYCAGQTATDAHGQPQCAGDMAGQIALSVDNLEAVLRAAGMTFADVVRLNIFATDVELLFQHYGVLMARLGATPPTTLLGVARLARPELMVEFEATAVA